MGGMSDDSYITAEGQYPYAWGVDVRRNPRFVTLQRAASTRVTTTGAPMCFGKVPQGGGQSDTFVMTDSGYVYYVDTGVAVWSNLGAEIDDCCYFAGYMYMFTPTQCYRIIKASCAKTANSWNGVPANIFATTAGDRRISVNYLDSKLFFIEGTKLRYVDSATPTVATDSGFNNAYQIVGLTQHADSLWIYTDDGKMYVWDIGNSVVIGVKNLEENIKWAAGNADVDYLATLPYSFSGTSLYVNAGVQPGSHQLIKKARFSSEISALVGENSVFEFAKGRLNAQSVAKVKGVDYLCSLQDLIGNAGSFPYGITTDTQHGYVYSYGKKGDGFPMSMVIDYRYTAAGNSMTWCGPLVRYKQGLLYGYLSKTAGGSTINGVDYVDTESASPANGYLTKGGILMPWEDNIVSELTGDAGHDREIRKEFSMLKMGAKIPTGCTVSVYQCLDDAGAWTLYKTFSQTDVVDSISCRVSTPSGKFSKNMLYIELNGSGTATPELYDLKYVLHPVSES
jgi:hypothetical protein